MAELSESALPGDYRNCGGSCPDLLRAPSKTICGNLTGSALKCLRTRTWGPFRVHPKLPSRETKEVFCSFVEAFLDLQTETPKTDSRRTSEVMQLLENVRTSKSSVRTLATGADGTCPTRRALLWAAFAVSRVGHGCEKSGASVGGQ